MAKQTFIFIIAMLPFLYIPCVKGGMHDHVSIEKSLTVPILDSIRAFSIRENDTLTYTLKLVLDKKNRPEYFFRNIFTPVCYTNECKPVHVNFYWDLLGNYVRYEMPAGKILTKIDHDEFQKEDYDKLADILSRPNSIFADLKMEDLMTKGTDSLADNVDAKTGATLKTIKNEVIDGAVYTCFTLWHIAYGKQVIRKMQEVTESYVGNEMLHSFLASNNYHYQYWAMDKVIDRSGLVMNGFEKDIDQIISGKNLFTARTALLKVGNSFLVGAKKQNWLWATYSATSYPMQVAILKRLENVPLIDNMEKQLAASIAGSNQELFRLKLGILAKQKQLSEQAQLILAKNLEMENEDFTAQIYQVLEHFQPKNIEVKDKMSRYKSK